MDNQACTNKKADIVNHLVSSLDWVESLSYLPEETWRLPVEAGKWSVAEVVRHIVSWDEFVLNKRLPYIFSGDQMPVAPNDEVVNAEAAIQARDDSKEKTVKQFKDTRQELLSYVQSLDEARFDDEIQLRSGPLTLYMYLKELKEHDLHHFGQIQQVT